MPFMPEKVSENTHQTNTAIGHKNINNRLLIDNLFEIKNY